MSEISSFVAIVVLAIFCVLFFLSRQRSPQEAGLTPLYEKRCQVTFKNSMALSAGTNVPLGRISLYEKFLAVSSLGVVVVPYNEIESIYYKKNPVFKTVALYIKRKDSKIYMRINLRNPEKMIEFLQKCTGRKIIERA